MLPKIKATCSFCRTDFECEPDDLIGWDIGWDGYVAIYACLPCQNRIDDEQRKVKEEVLEADLTYTQELDTFSDADLGL